MMMLGLTGQARSGKSTVAGILTKEHWFQELAFADFLKRQLQEIYQFTNEQLWGNEKERPDRRYPRTAKAREFNAQPLIARLSDLEWHAALETVFEQPLDHFLSSRVAAQLFGTEAGRAAYEDTWVDRAFEIAEAIAAAPGTWGYEPRWGMRDRRKERDGARPKGFVFSDVRFSNEADAIRKRGGFIWKTVHGQGLGGSLAQHESEQHVGSLRADVVLPDCSLEELPAIVAAALRGLRGETDVGKGP